jgi:hypothetical protein
MKARKKPPDRFGAAPWQPSHLIRCRIGDAAFFASDRNCPEREIYPLFTLRLANGMSDRCLGLIGSPIVSSRFENCDAS